MNDLLFTVAFLFATLVQSTTFTSLGYNTRYSISRPHYLYFFGPIHQKWPEPTSDKVKNIPSKEDPVNIPYDIPRETFKKVFSCNLPSKKFR